ncbi:helix-turn-helix domain-containing protein [Caldalkalibacillus thermarum TA2.A1]|uniref:Helix-turn-helix domain-containing protein n=1 Tax=Caldalkalibacillus thermarum (strain TA2.A1) TaxID=986075 RepID=A0A8X8L6A0_CALTT|nr:helix-turn-helix domain-containing protein [Caldalkalibacillus thermarum]QZT32602.1 helix-turn-helix domain-containing protein [Caldalkalibacillus thermarum TA2.A1]
MKGLDVLLLYMLQQLNGERTVSSCYHILTGRKSTQAIQDAELFGFSAFYGLLQDLSRHDYDRTVSGLSVAGYLSRQEKDRFLVTKAARSGLKQQLTNLRFFERAFKWKQTGRTMQDIRRFWGRFQLLGQVISYYLAGAGRYQPAISDMHIQTWVKSFWKGIKDKHHFAREWVHSLTQHLSEFDDDLLAHLLLDRLSGYKVAGYTYKQLEHRYGIPEVFVRIYTLQAAATLYMLSQKRSTLFTRLTEENLREEAGLMQSALETYRLLRRGHTLEEIANLRGLKQSTIEDHVIDIAIHNPDFDYRHFISDDVMKAVRQVSKRLQTKRIRPIKEHLPDDISYFQIRLALVKGEEHETGEPQGNDELRGGKG